jgi:hypothetical protein
MPRTPTKKASSDEDVKPYDRNGPESPNKKAAKPWSTEDKLTLLLAVLETAKPDFNKIAQDKFADQGRNANQVSQESRCERCIFRNAG